MKGKFNLLAVLIAILVAGSGSLGAQVPVTYRFSADNLFLDASDPDLGPLLNGSFPEGVFTYDSSVAQTGINGAESSSPGAQRYGGSLTNLAGSVNGLNFSDPRGRTTVGNDRFEFPQPDGSTELTDILQLTAESRVSSNLLGFEIGGYTLANVLMFWIEGNTGITDFLLNENLPTALPDLESGITFVFALIGDPSVRKVVRFGGLTVSPVPVANINFSGQLEIVEVDDGSGIYSGVPIGTDFFGAINIATSEGFISDGTSLTPFGCCLDTDRGLEVENDAVLEAGDAALLTALAGPVFSAGDIVDIIEITGDTLTAEGGRIEIGLVYVLDSGAFDNDNRNNFPPDPNDILIPVFFINEENGGDVYFGVGTFTTDADGDGDGIQNAIDGTFTNAFDDQSAVFSNDFTDQHLGGSTFGTFDGRNNLSVAVLDHPTLGVILTATGGPGTAEVQMCTRSGVSIFLTNGDQFIATCGSFIGETVAGQAVVTIGTITITIPSGATVLITELQDSFFSIENVGDPMEGGSILIDDGGMVTNLNPGDPVLFLEVVTGGGSGDPTPTAVDDSVSTNSGVALIIDVLSNDSDPDGDALTVASVSQGTNGSVVINSGARTVTYTPASNFTGTDSFSYTVTDPFGGFDTATVTVSVIGPPETVLVANFVNGNNTVFNSRVYLFNPSESAGDVTVRVFTLPPSGFGLAQELTGAPFDLGTLEAKSALNLKLAEDILTPLGITLPYTDNDGDLTLEFTIQANRVGGTAQVFSSSLAFGTYPLQEIPPASSGSPTVLVANFTNGNNDAFDSRVYLFNPSAGAGKVTVRIFTLPVSGGLAQELTTTLPLSLGTLGPKSALSVKVAEDILAPLGITTPYITDGGKLTLEFTIQAENVRGAAQVFSSSFAFGVYPLQEIPAVSAGSPTVLAANLMNGNTDVLKSRVYLWNPSFGAGDVTVRVFTLPLTGGVAQELTGTLPLNLGTLGAKSALNVKVAEDILTPLGITTPYITDGGNLTLEFTIQAADVRGAAQVFSNSFGFGTYPLQVMSPTSSGSPKVLVANFTNGNNTVFNSRVYLWNSSFGAGDVTVRVFTLPLTGGVAQELTGTLPLNLGTLGARSALNVKLAEDILTPLGITTPYITDGGNLTLEFTIQAENVRGTVQVFSSSFSFGTYPLQQIQ